MDCLVCHDTTGSYDKIPTGAGKPSPKVDLEYVAKNVGPPSRNNCGNCHFSGGGGDNVKHGDLSNALRYPKRNCDIHMGGYNFTCTECHKTTNHKIPGRSSYRAAGQGAKKCVDCHTEKPHYGDSLLYHHLNKHCRHVACNTCHSPIYAKCQPTKVWWDWSVAGNKTRQVHKDQYGMPDYHWKKGTFEWKKYAQPSYAWYNGYMQRTLAGEKVELKGKVVDPEASKQAKQQGEYIHLSHPVGSKKDPDSKISPFKIMRGVQGVDPKNRLVLVPHLFPYGKNDQTAYWKNLNWQKTYHEGMQAMDLPYSGKYVWARTDMYWPIEHEVLPQELALGCTNCHQSLTKGQTCGRCHKKNRAADFEELANNKDRFKKMQKKGWQVEHLIQEGNYLDFKALGYEGDPIIHGGRFEKLPLDQK